MLRKNHWNKNNKICSASAEHFLLNALRLRAPGLQIEIDDLGRHEEAIEEYSKFIALADPERDKYLIERAKQIIAKLKS